MLPNPCGPEHAALPGAQRAALDAVASVVVGHLQAELSQRPADASAPLLINVDGPSDTDLVDLVSERLGCEDARPRWTAIRFDAWQYQRVEPPWWWLITAIDRQLRAEFRKRDRQLRAEFRKRGKRVARRKRLLDYRWRLGRLLTDLVPMIPLVLVAAGLWYLTGQLAMDEFLKWAAGVAGALTTVAAFLWTASNALRRLFVGVPANAAATMRASDPMADFQRRYSFLIRSAETPVVLVVNNLDRCRGDYVVGLLEGIQTLLKSPASAMERTPLVAVLVPAERSWLCDSYLDVYEEFRETAREPGRPFGLAFIEKVFDYLLRLPAIPFAASIPDDDAATDDVCGQVRAATSEREIRGLVAGAEREHAAGPLYRLRVDAVERLGELEVQDPERLCFDTARELDRLLERVSAAPAVVRQLRAAYCVQRTTQLLGGHAVDADEAAIPRLATWALLQLCWPLLTQRLVDRPEELELLRARSAPTDADEELKQVFRMAAPGRLSTAWPGAELTPDYVRQFSTPLDAAEPGGATDRRPALAQHA